MARSTAWVMSEADTYGLLNAIETRLAVGHLDQRQFDVLVRLRETLEDDVEKYRRGVEPASADADFGFNTVGVI